MTGKKVMTSVLGVIEGANLAKYLQGFEDVTVVVGRLTNNIVRLFASLPASKRLIYRSASSFGLKHAAEAGIVGGISPGISGFLIVAKGGKLGTVALLEAGGFSSSFVALSSEAWHGGRRALEKLASDAWESATEVGPSEFGKGLECRVALRSDPERGVNSVFSLIGHMLGVSLSSGRRDVSKLSEALSMYRERAHLLGMPEEEYLRRVVAGLCGGVDAVSAALVKACRQDPGRWVAGLPCAAILSVNAVVKKYGKFKSGVEFYTRVLKSAVEVAYAFNASDVAEFLREELAKLRTQQYRGYVVRRIGAVTLLLILALPGRCRITMWGKGQAWRRISCK